MDSFLLALTTSTSHMQSCFEIDLIFIKLSNVYILCLKAGIFFGDCHEMEQIWAKIQVFDQVFKTPTV